MIEPDKVVCSECDQHMLAMDALSAPNPFEPDDMLWGCPNCKAVNSMRMVCDEPGCQKEGTCGWPGKDGIYRRTCYEHWDKS